MVIPIYNVLHFIIMFPSVIMDDLSVTFVQVPKNVISVRAIKLVNIGVYIIRMVSIIGDMFTMG